MVEEDMAEQGKRSSSSVRRVWTSVLGVVAGFLVMILLVAGGVKLFGGSGKAAAQEQQPSSSPSTSSAPVNIPVPVVSSAELAALPRATTEGTVKAAPVNLTAGSGGNLVFISKNITGFAAPGKNPITVIPYSQFAGRIWLPVIARMANWVQVRLPSRPNGSTAWIPLTGLRTARTSWSVHVSLSSGTLEVSKGGVLMGEWTVGQGATSTPTPIGQTFLLAGFVDPDQDFSPIIYATGAHSNTLDSYGGGPGTVAIHGWPTEDGRRGKVSHGCVRVPAAALAMFAELPAGTPIDITA
ncbi:L,D-transpeptidase [Rudaeicoccus suwonensis]|nr:L,D-transpeptidase [Rudaeicoccus suwonensis]